MGFLWQDTLNIISIINSVCRQEYKTAVGTEIAVTFHNNLLSEKHFLGSYCIIRLNNKNKQVF